MRKKLTFLALPVLFSLLAGCSFLPVPKEQRYTEIYKALSLLEYTKSGEIESETQDNTDGVTTSSSITLKIKGEDTYKFITTRLLENFPGKKCSVILDTQTKCNYKGLSFFVGRKKIESEKTTLIVSDISSGRETYL